MKKTSSVNFLVTFLLLWQNTKATCRRKSLFGAQSFRQLESLVTISGVRAVGRRGVQ